MPKEEKPRTRLIQQHEYDAVYHAALSQRPPYLAVMMELAYLCRMRMSETRLLKRSDLHENGLLVRRAKGSKDEITLWSDRLRAAVTLAKSINRDTISPYLLHNANGKPITTDQYKMASHRALLKTGHKVMAGGKVVKQAEFTFHDIKAMGVTHHTQKASGHKTKKMEAVYDRLPSEVPPTR
ncbi:MAG: tyrosine-type recombinase/integrase [Pseudomonadales bacterium]